MIRRWNNGWPLCALLLALFALGGGGMAAHAQITDFGTGGPQVTPHESGPSPAPSASGGAGVTSGTGSVPGGGGGEMSGTAQGSTGPGAGNERGMLYTLLPWLFVMVVFTGLFSWLAKARGRKGQEQVPVAEGGAGSGSAKKH